jgi:hypothetical protein
VENTLDKMNRLIEDFDWEKERLFYMSSWWFYLFILYNL